MEGVYAKLKENGIAFTLGLEDVFREMYEPFYKEPDAEKVNVISDIEYGLHERNKLDIYVPIGKASKAVILYLHGGGFFSGDKAWSKKVYGNLGHFFAERGIIFVAANHHLVPDAVYPQGSEDVQLAREWVYQNIASERYGGGDVNKVVLVGHSSGAALIASNLYSAGDPNLPTRDPLFPPAAGVAYFSAPWWFDMQKPLRRKIMTSYFGSPDESVWEPVSPLGLFKRVPADSPVLDSDRLPTLLGSVKWETKEATDGALMFFNAFRERSTPVGSLPLFQVLDKHNHLSNILSIGTEDDAQGDALLKFVMSCVEKL